VQVAPDVYPVVVMQMHINRRTTAQTVSFDIFHPTQRTATQTATPIHNRRQQRLALGHPAAENPGSQVYKTHRQHLPSLFPV